MNHSTPLHRHSSDIDAAGSRSAVLGEPPGMTKLFVFTHPLASTAILLAGFFLAAIVSG